MIRDKTVCLLPFWSLNRLSFWIKTKYTSFFTLPALPYQIGHTLIHFSIHCWFWWQVLFQDTHFFSSRYRRHNEFGWMIGWNFRKRDYSTPSTFRTLFVDVRPDTQKSDFGNPERGWVGQDSPQTTGDISATCGSAPADELQQTVYVARCFKVKFSNKIRESSCFQNAKCSKRSTSWVYFPRKFVRQLQLVGSINFLNLKLNRLFSVVGNMIRAKRVTRIGWTENVQKSCQGVSAVQAGTQIQTSSLNTSSMSLHIAAAGEAVHMLIRRMK